jgi:dihydroxyacid dehydratase/phosphogluconate dehydratase
MKILLCTLGLIGLLATVLPAILVFSGVMEPGTHKTVMVIGMIVWFATAPFFMKRKKSI